MIIMNCDKIDLTNFTEYQTIIQLMKTTGLIKDKTEQYQSQNNLGEYYE